jgi:hypothetical protein
MNTTLTIPFTLDRQDLKSQLSIKPGRKVEERIEYLFDEVEKIARPKAIYRVSYIENLGFDTVTVDSAVFHSQVLRFNLAGIHRIFPFVVTCGTEVANTPIEQDDPLEDYWLRVISLSLVRISMDGLRASIQDQYGIEKLSAMNPGSAEVDIWPIEEQPSLFDLFGGTQVVEDAIGVRLLPTHFMTPDMSASGILFPSDATYFNCQLCQRQDCPSRQAEFDAALWETIQSKL